MDINYSQFVTMYPELLVLAVFIIVLLVDIFFGKKAQKALTHITLVLFGLITVAMWFIPIQSTEAFGGMYVNTQVCVAIKGILNLGVFLVILQCQQWIDSEEGSIRRGEFFELLLVTLFGMYLMISARHFLLFISQCTGCAIGICTPGFSAITFLSSRHQNHMSEFSCFLILTSHQFSINTECAA